MSSSGPATAWAWDQLNISGETWTCASASIQPERAWEVKRWGEEWQIIAKCWWAKLVASNKKDLRLSRYLVKLYLVKDMNTYAMYLFVFLFFLYIYEVTILFLLCKYGA